VKITRQRSNRLHRASCAGGYRKLSQITN